MPEPHGHGSFRPTRRGATGAAVASLRRKGLNDLIDGFEKNEILRGFHWRTLPLRDELAPDPCVGLVAAGPEYETSRMCCRNGKLGPPLSSPRHLRQPPIVEVVCGFVFEPVAGLDAVATGLYWHRCRPEYPTKQIQPAVGGPAIGFGVAPMRTWLISKDGDHVLQVQQDRFYFNWKRVGNGEYPHFNTYGDRKGVLDRSLEEFDGFARFCESELGRRPVTRSLELAKVDRLDHGKHWRDLADLGVALPAVASVGAVASSAQPVIQVSMFEERGDREVHVSVSNAIVTEAFTRAVQMETRVVARSFRDQRETFASLNVLANDLFLSSCQNPRPPDSEGSNDDTVCIRARCTAH